MIMEINFHCFRNCFEIKSRGCRDNPLDSIHSPGQRYTRNRIVIKTMLMKKVIFLLSLLFIVGSCKKDYELEKIDSDILVEIGKNDSGVIIHGETERVYSCFDHQIIYCEKTRKDEIYVQFKKVKIPNMCLTALGPAGCTIELGNLDDGEYSVTFELNNKKTKGKLKVGATTELTLDSGGNVKPI